jgi:hypothetical protein
VQVATGALYGFWMGLLVSWIGTSAGQCLAFLLGRYLFRPTVKTYLHNTWPTFPAIDTAIKKEGWKLVGRLGVAAGTAGSSTPVVRAREQHTVLEHGCRFMAARMVALRYRRECIAKLP